MSSDITGAALLLRMARTPTPDNLNLLPDFGSRPVALRVAFLAILIATVVIIGRNGFFNENAWRDVQFLLPYALLIALLGMFALKAAAPVLGQLQVNVALFLAFLLILLVIVLATEIVVQILVVAGLSTAQPDWHADLLLRALMVGALVSGIGLRYLVISHRAERDSKSEQQSRMQALQSRIRPHFLFNSMNSIASLMRTDPARAELALTDLADLFRVLLADARNLVPIAAEREISRQYLEIEKLRLGDRLKVSWNISNVPKSALVPALTLQPLLENAIYHGIEPRLEGGTVKIELWAERKLLNVMISNPLPEHRSATRGRGNKIAMENIRQRLASHFGKEASMQSFEQNGHFHVKLRMPIVRGTG